MECGECEGGEVLPVHVPGAVCRLRRGAGHLFRRAQIPHLMCMSCGNTLCLACWCAPGLVPVLDQVARRRCRSTMVLQVVSRMVNVANIVVSFVMTVEAGSTATWGAWAVAALEFGLMALVLVHALVLVVGWVWAWAWARASSASASARDRSQLFTFSQHEHAHEGAGVGVGMVRRLAGAFGMLSLNALTFFPTYEMLQYLANRLRRMLESAIARIGPGDTVARVPAPVPESVSVPMSPSSTVGILDGGGGGLALVDGDGDDERVHWPWRVLLAMAVYVPVAVVALCLRLASVTSIVGQPSRTPLDWSLGEWLALVALINNLNTMGRTEAVDEAIGEYLTESPPAVLGSAAAPHVMADVVDETVFRRGGAAQLFIHRAFGVPPHTKIAILGVCLCGRIT